MNLKVLRYFLEIAKTENISKAADNLYITQPALSRHIMELENELGVKLFTRDKRRLQLTEEGALLVKRSEEILSLVNKTAEEFSSSKDIISGSVY
ncbi:MAG: LysR family transcriptional regulator, partial [Mucispirillum sp.]|nr:LysR family transcriptional regulator [Mucispirillum sp.]